MKTSSSIVSVIVYFVLACVATLAPRDVAAQTGDLRLSSLFIQTDETLGNRVIAFFRDGNGHLTEAGRFLTGGFGVGEALGEFSAGNTILGTIGGRQFLFVTNSRSNDISVFRVNAQNLTLVSKTPTGGIHPISVAQRGNLVYVLHDLSGDMTGFSVDSDGQVQPIPGSRRTVTGANAAAPFNVLFDNTGTKIVVSDSNSQFIDVFTVDPITGLTNGPNPNLSAGVEPFGMLFDAANHLIVSEGNFDLPLSSTASTYNLDGTTLHTISGAVKDFRQFSCWVAITKTGFNGGQFVYISNNGDSTISSFFLGPDGSLTLVQQVAAVTGAFPAIGAEDETISSDGAFLYVTSFGTPLTGGFVNAYAIQPDGALVSIQQISGLPIGVAGSAGR